MALHTVIILISLVSRFYIAVDIPADSIVNMVRICAKDANAVTTSSIKDGDLIGCVLVNCVVSLLFALQANDP